jgi:phage-related minor tail protein
LGFVINKIQRAMKYQNVMTEEFKELKIRRNSNTDQRAYLKIIKL